jgi:hypothetical protein
VLAGILAGAGSNLGRQQVHDETVLVRRPNGAVTAKETCASTLFSGETVRTVEKAPSKPLKAHRHFA